MLFATVGQGARFVWMMAAGAALGAWYMATALLRRFLQAGFWLSLGCDLLFGLGAAVILLAALVMGCYGQVRAFDLIGALLGTLLFGVGLMRPLWNLLRRLRQKLARFWAFLSNRRLIRAIFK